jgi:hypothetical protein
MIEHVTTAGVFSLDGQDFDTGHGESTTIGAEAPHLDEWVARGH